MHVFRNLALTKLRLAISTEPNDFPSESKESHGKESNAFTSSFRHIVRAKSRGLWPAMIDQRPEEKRGELHWTAFFWLLSEDA
jgi:hypothetical protein